MLLFRILSYLSGYIRIEVPEHCLEKFVNLAITRGIFLWDINSVGAQRVALKVRLDHIQPLRHVARITRCRFKIRDRVGIPFFVARLRRRKALPLGALIFIATLYILSSFVWFIEVTGNKDVETTVIEQVAREAGLNRGVLKWSVNSSQVEEKILQQVPSLSWVGLEMNGTRAEIKVVEKVLPGKNHHGQPMDVVAVKDGLVKEILVFSGHPLVEEGDTVSVGQVLITAAMPPAEKIDNETREGQEEETDEHLMDKEEPVQYVRARGVVRARVWYKGYGEMQLMEKGTALTGRETTKLGLKVGAKKIILAGPREVPYDNYDVLEGVKKLPKWRNLELPVELVTVKYLEKEQYIRNYDLSQARSLASDRALASVKAQLPQGAKIVNRRLQVIDTAQPEELVRVQAVVEALEDIGVEKPHPGDGVMDLTQGGN